MKYAIGAKGDDDNFKLQVKDITSAITSCSLLVEQNPAKSLWHDGLLWRDHQEMFWLSRVRGSLSRGFTVEHFLTHYM